MQIAHATLALCGMLASTLPASAGDLETLFNDLTTNQREYVQIRLRAPGFYHRDVDGQFGEHTAVAILNATRTPGFQHYRMTARQRGLQDEEEIALYYVMSNVYLQTVVKR